MKLIVLLLFSCSVFAQGITKGTNVIIISTTMPDSALYKVAGKSLLENGYTINKANRDFMEIQTDAKKVKGRNSYPRLVVSVNDSKVKVSGYFGSEFGLESNVTNDITRITYRGMSGSPFMVAFESMNEYAKGLAATIGGNISYVITK
ncbi:hypothetical protein [Spirosoma pollinicola]|uniref:DUF4252 domain-containing protein n=1 Tax=Spirosoma pollinicola TaxID=2057025 RepID=A0A2K8ZAW7_9BACT|nr:hypothetical protein [Spirosoma pollinicola]AUD07026.1 hypothetical protein CWM47_37515 [Spirosoma pollinicola]